MITIAAAKGYLLSDAIAALSQIGIEFEEGFADSRKLSTLSKDGQIQLLQIRPWDVPMYVANGAADLGVVGWDVLREQSPDCIQLMDLKFGKCDLVIAGLEAMSPDKLKYHLTVATKYPLCTQSYFKSRNIKADVIKLYGAIELAPLTGLSDIVCDLTATGKTLKENGLSIIDTVFHSTARLIANPINFRFHYDRISTLVRDLSDAETVGDVNVANLD